MGHSRPARVCDLGQSRGPPSPPNDATLSPRASRSSFLLPTPGGNVDMVVNPVEDRSNAEHGSQRIRSHDGVVARHSNAYVSASATQHGGDVPKRPGAPSSGPVSRLRHALDASVAFPRIRSRTGRDSEMGDGPEPQSAAPSNPYGFRFSSTHPCAERTGPVGAAVLLGAFSVEFGRRKTASRLAAQLVGGLH